MKVMPLLRTAPPAAAVAFVHGRRSGAEPFGHLDIVATVCIPAMAVPVYAEQSICVAVDVVQYGMKKRVC